MNANITAILRTALRGMQSTLGESASVGGVEALALVVHMGSDGFDYALGGQYDKDSVSLLVSKVDFPTMPELKTPVVFRGVTYRLDDVRESVQYWQLDNKQITS